MLKLGFAQDGKPDWERVLSRAGVPESQRYVTPSRWGGNKKQMRKVIEFLQNEERKRTAPTEHGARLLGLSEWEQLGRSISEVPEIFERELSRLRPIAEAASKVAEGERARAALFSPTPESKGKRK